MRNNIQYFRHECSAYRNRKFKMLRVKYGWAGEGRFWALNSIIGERENCILKLDSKMAKMDVASEIDMQPDELTEFIRYLKDECDLLIEKDGGYTTKEVQKNFEYSTSKRKSDRNRQRRKRSIEKFEQETKYPGKNQESNETSDKSHATKPYSEAKEKELIDTLMNYFGFDEIDNEGVQVAKWREIKMFVSKLIEKEFIDWFVEQFRYYRKYKDLTGEKKHNFNSFIGHNSEEYMDGGWDSANWKKKLEDYEKELKSNDNPKTIRASY